MVFALTALVLTGLPLWLLAAAFASRWLPGRWRGLKLLSLFVVYLLIESLTLLAAFALWVASGFGRRVQRDHWQRAHYWLMRWYLAVLVCMGQTRFHVRFDVDHEEARLAEEGRPPLIVLSRHAGPGDSFLLVHGLLQVGYRPRIVLRSTMQWSPTIDVVLHRVPCHFVRRGVAPGTGTRAIAALAAGLGPGDALVLFPEGRNYTPDRRLHSITKLEELGQHGEAEEARELRYVLSPRAGGALAALDAAPHAEVAFVAHTGLEDLSNVVDLWRGLPMDAAVKVKLWRVPPTEVPGPRGARQAWLAWWWRRIDAWILDHYGERAVPDQVIEAVVEELPELQDTPAASPESADAQTHAAAPAACFPDLVGADADLESLHGGWDSDVHLVDGQLVVRIARRPAAVEVARAEARVLPVLAVHLPADVPRPLAVCDEHGAMVYPWIPGDAASAERLAELDVGRIADQLAEMLLALRAIPLETGREAGIPDLSGARWIELHTELAARFKRLGLRRLPDDRAAAAARFLTAMPDLLVELGAAEAVAIVHADLGPDHVRCDATGLRGVIDWGDVRIGDPAIDLAWLLHGAPNPLADAVHARLDPTPAEVARAGIYHRLGPWFEVEHGLLVAEPGLVRSGVAGVIARLPGWRNLAVAARRRAGAAELLGAADEVSVAGHRGGAP